MDGGLTVYSGLEAVPIPFYASTIPSLSSGNRTVHAPRVCSTRSWSGNNCPSTGRWTNLWLFSEMWSRAQGSVLAVCCVQCASTHLPVH